MEEVSDIDAGDQGNGAVTVEKVSRLGGGTVVPSKSFDATGLSEVSSREGLTDIDLKTYCGQ
jgi:hypothetical protein